MLKMKKLAEISKEDFTKNLQTADKMDQIYKASCIAAYTGSAMTIAGLVGKKGKLTQVGSVIAMISSTIGGVAYEIERSKIKKCRKNMGYAEAWEAVPVETVIDYIKKVVKNQNIVDNDFNDMDEFYDDLDSNDSDKEEETIVPEASEDSSSENTQED